MLRKEHLALLFGALLLISPLFISAHGGVNDDELIIRMNENGFEPKELTVVEGDTVLFINNDDVLRWPASNFHPTHTLYPEFDSLQGIKPGESWKMTFEKSGTWRMHDHLIPHMTGTILVLEDPDKKAEDTPRTSEKESFWTKIKNFFSKLLKVSARNTAAIENARLEEFKNLNEQEKYSWLEKISQEGSPELAWEYVVAAYQNAAGTVGKAHDMAHLVGQLLFKKYDFDGLSFCTPVFAFGCYHGLMEVAFTGKTPAEYEKSIVSAQKGCQKLGNNTSPSYWSCIHGIGHGTITFREHETQQALDDCDLVEVRVRTYCYDGVFMELSISATPNFYRKSDPLYPCNAIKEHYRSACARAQSRVMRSFFGLSTTQAAELCEKSGSETIRYHCIDSMGYSIAQGSEGKPDSVVKGCSEMVSQKSRAQCLAAAAGELVFQNAAGWPEATKKICDTLSNGDGAACRARVEQVKTSYGR